MHCNLSKENYLKNWVEPEGSFPYQRPTEELLAQYQHINDTPIPYPLCKRLFEIALITPLFLALFLPFAVLYSLIWIEARLRKETYGPLYYYFSMSGSRVIKKWKLRVISQDAVCTELAEEGDWRAWSSEWIKSDRLFWGDISKKIYLDEFPQLFAVLVGQMSLVGPRPLSLLHAERDIAQGNFTRKILRGGLIGFGHVRKGTEQFGMPSFEFEYASILKEANCLKILKADLWVIKEAVKLVFKAGGH